jgi:transposase-like protein
MLGVTRAAAPCRRSSCRSLSRTLVATAISEALGEQAAISKSTVSAICGQIKDEYEAWARRRLDGITLDYLFLDASFFRMHPGSPAEPVLAAWGITTGGKPVFIGLAPGNGESTDAWHSFLADLTGRGLPSPLLVISDGAPGLISAIEQTFPRALRQRCLIHRNVLAKVPAGMQAEIKTPTGPSSTPKTSRPSQPQARRDRRSPDHRDGRPIRRYLSLGDEMPARRPRRADRLRFPAEHHHRIRHSNFIERTFGETRRRVKVIGRLPGETSCLTLVWAVLDRASRGWRGLTMTADGLRLLQDLRRSLLDTPRQLRPRAAKVQPPPAPRGHFPKDRFGIDLHAGTVTCPAGITAVIRARGGRHAGAASFGAACRTCPLAAQCTTAPYGRTITIGPYEAGCPPPGSARQTRRGKPATAQAGPRSSARSAISCGGATAGDVPASAARLGSPLTSRCSPPRSTSPGSACLAWHATAERGW